MTKRLTTARLLVEGAGFCSDLWYASGFQPVDPVVFLDEGTRRTLVVPMLEFGRARAEASTSEVVLPEHLGIPPEERRSLGQQALHVLRHRQVTQVEVHSFFPAGIARLLEQNGVKVEIRAGSLYPERMVKTAEEIAKIAKAQRASVAAMRAAADILRASSKGRHGVLKWKGATLTSERVREAIDTTLLRHGCIARDTIVAGGAQAADPHDRGHGPLKAGEAIVIDIFPQDKRTGYWGDITRTFCKGRPSPALARMYRTVLAAQKQSLAMIRHGVVASTIHAANQAYFNEQGFPTTVKDGVVRGFFHGTGHGVGLDIHEAPSIGLAAVTLRAGHVVTVEPGLYDPDVGGVRIEDTVAVEPARARILAAFPKSFEV